MIRAASSSPLVNKYGSSVNEYGAQTPPTVEPVEVEELINWFERAEEATDNERKYSERDRDYYDNIQLTAAEIATLEARGQPPVIINRIKRKVDYLKGHEAKTRTDPLALPRTPKHEEEAHGITDALRFVADEVRFAQTKTNVWEEVLVEGCGGAIVTCGQTSKGEPRIHVKQVHWDRLFRDPHCRERDFSDARYMGMVIWKDFADASSKYPEFTDVLEITLSGANSETFDDRPRHRYWADGKRKRVRIVEMYYRHDGVWFQATFTKGGLLGPNEPCKYLDQDGEPDCPLVLFSAFCNRDNERYGIVRELIPNQDEFNKRRGKALHISVMRQVMMEQGAADPQEVRTQLAKPDGVVIIQPGMKFEVLPTHDQFEAQVELLAMTAAELELAGPNSAMQGKDAHAPSGRAIIANQQGGAVELEPLLDGLRDWQRRVMTQVWCRIRQYWTEETWVRVTDDEKNLKWVGINQPVMQETPYGPMQVGVKNAVGELNVDISIMEAPDTANLQSEQFEQITAMVAAGVPIPPDVIIQLSSLRNKDAIVERMTGNPEQAAQKQQEDAAKGEAVFRADLEKTNSETARNIATAEKTKIDAAIAFSGHVMPERKEEPEANRPPSKN